MSGHGVTLLMKAIGRPEPKILHVAAKYDEKGRRLPGGGLTYVNPDRDRSLSGKVRRRARKVHRAEDRAFWERGTFPASATAISMCSCGARAFARGRHPDLSDFDEAHDQCEVAS